MEKILKELNPWWVKSNILKNEKFIERKVYLEKLKKLINVKEIITISGIRRVGKSILQRQLIKYLIEIKKINPKNILFFNIDILDLDSKKNNPLETIKEEYFKLNNPEGKVYFFLDEIQNLENWEKFVKIQYDLNSRIKFILTGSNSKLLYSNLSKLLTGRVLNVHIFPLSFKEYLLFVKKDYDDLDLDKIKLYNLFKKYLKIGSFPETALEKNLDINKQRVQEYFNSIILRDILELNNIRDSKNVIELSKYLLSNSTKLMSYNKLSQIFGISKTTIKEYIIAFENAFLISELNKFDYSLKKQLLNEKKIYILNSDFLILSFKFSEDLGRSLENLVFLELKRLGKEIYYNKDKNECDFIIKEECDIIGAIQVSKSLKDINTKKREFDGLLESMNLYNLKEGLILTDDEEGEEFIEGKKIIIKSIWRWLLEN